MKTKLNDFEELVKKGPSNLQKGYETVGGFLFLTNQRLIFEAHAINIQGGNTLIDLSDVESTEKCWTKFLNVIPLMPNSLAVHTKSGEEYRFVLFRRGAWQEKINERLL